MYLLLTVLLVIVAVGLIMSILAQSSKGGALEGMVGSTASTMLGGQAASKFLKNATRILAFIFMILCILLAFQMRNPVTSTSSKAVDKLKEEVVEETVTEEELPELPPLEESSTDDQ